MKGDICNASLPRGLPLRTLVFNGTRRYTAASSRTTFSYESRLHFIFIQSENAVEFNCLCSGIHKNLSLSCHLSPTYCSFFISLVFQSNFERSCLNLVPYASLSPKITDYLYKRWQKILKRKRIGHSKEAVWLTQ